MMITRLAREIGLVTRLLPPADRVAFTQCTLKRVLARHVHPAEAHR